MVTTLISKLEPGLGNPTIRLRVSRFWEFRDQNDENILYHLGLVLVDGTGASIAAQIMPPLDELFAPAITEGKVYDLTFYRVRQCTSQYRPVGNMQSIALTKWSTLEECTDVPENFPNYVYSLTPYDQLRGRVNRKDSFTGTVIQSYPHRLPFFLLHS
jgi:hypothetical protein